MAVDYDLVIMGDSAAGCWAAIAAARLQARVALVTTPGCSSQLHDLTLALREMAFKAKQARLLMPFELAPQDSAGYGQGPITRARALDLARVSQWADQMVSDLTQRRQAALMSELGIDRIVGPGEWQRHPEVQVQVGGRQLRSRAYLLALEPELAPCPIPGLSRTTARDLLQQAQGQKGEWPSEAIVIGDGPTATALSQALARLGTAVTLLVRQGGLLPDEDMDAAALVQAQLEADGVCVRSEGVIQAVVARPDQRHQVVTDSTALETQAVIWATDAGHRAVPWDLAELGLTSTARGVWVNPKLQTTHPRIYACGAILGGYPLAHVARYEAGIALKNALFGPFWSVDYRSMPWAIWTEPVLARVGLTEAQARQRYRQVHVLKQFYPRLDRAYLQGETTGLCKFVVQANGQILGAHWVGAGAAEHIPLVAWAMQQRYRVQDLANWVPIDSTYAEIIRQMVTTWQNQRCQRDQGWRRWLFNLRRNWQI